MGRALKVGECSLKEVNAEEVGTDTGVTALLMGLAQCPDLEGASIRHFSAPLQEKTVELAMKNVKNGDVWPKLKHLLYNFKTSSLKPVRVMLSQENGVFAFEGVIQTYIIFSRLLTRFTQFRRMCFRDR